MNSNDSAARAEISEEKIVLVPHFIKGQTVLGADIRHRSRDLGTDFATPALDLDGMVWQRGAPGPAFDLPVEQVIDFLVRVGERLTLDKNELLREALEGMVRVSELGRRILENCYNDICHMFSREVMLAEVRESLGSLEVIDGWKVRDLHQRKNRIRAFPPRLVHILAGNSPMVAAMTIVRAALSKGVHLLKLPSNDLFTATAILRTMAAVDPDHPVTRSFSIAYWKGGDVAVESILYRAQYFDKIVVWGGESAVRHAQSYVGPGFEMIAYDPKVSISMVGQQAFGSDEALREVAMRGAADVLSFNQDACNASRFQFVEGDTEQCDRYSALLAEAMGIDVRYGGGHYLPTPADIRDEVDMLKMLEPVYAVFGGYEGRGLVVRSDEPVGFHPNVKTVNVVQVSSLADALRYVTVATQTVGVWPPSRKRELRDGLASAGVQRIVSLGEANAPGSFGGMPHDATIPLHRFMKWITEEGDETP
ncbi:long-chain-fatty-acyl-CoA reductase [Herbaspirillum rubrisubalbicans]|uniref:Acyl-CoA reductase n=1 Tax=Herbaspirillum rubrisubalbicans TaxID=80842 RepID=A0ABX9C7F9_9BURK|nr:acyl-CoA reductase [Herbaspirillum rubrisubalbicans]NQE47265.1 long-chain-fatty-acyl-CoA reductase [Herbaspirillum rubrisubalbicans]RAM66782.1 long-chain-fatty-acyl-CoA reductase [Herbaspirillum rubrisubalbicans]RAN47441.1 long-chain-fatty-acyl-CoA reductase [Herbaspirillum rubrisubalbicans]